MNYFQNALSKGIGLSFPGINTAFKGLDMVISHSEVFLRQPGRASLLGSITVKDDLLILGER